MQSKEFRAQVERDFDLDQASPTARLIFDQLLALLDELADLEAAIAEHGLMIQGARGQLVVNPAVASSRQTRVAIARLAGQLGLGGETQGTRPGRHAANSRWGNL